MSRLQQLLKLLEMDERDADVLYMIAQEHAQERRFEEAAGWYDRCIEVEPMYLYAHFHKAKALESAGRAEEAKQTLKHGLELAESAGDAKARSEFQQYLEEL